MEHQLEAGRLRTMFRPRADDVCRLSFDYMEPPKYVAMN